MTRHLKRKKDPSCQSFLTSYQQKRRFARKSSNLIFYEELLFSESCAIIIMNILREVYPRASQPRTQSWRYGYEQKKKAKHLAAQKSAAADRGRSARAAGAHHCAGCTRLLQGQRHGDQGQGVFHRHDHRATPVRRAERVGFRLLRRLPVHDKEKAQRAEQAHYQK